MEKTKVSVQRVRSTGWALHEIPNTPHRLTRASAQTRNFRDSFIALHATRLCTRAAQPSKRPTPTRRLDANNTYLSIFMGFLYNDRVTYFAISRHVLPRVPRDLIKQVPHPKLVCNNHNTRTRIRARTSAR
jgi:hypothetical protein